MLATGFIIAPTRELDQAHAGPLFQYGLPKGYKGCIGYIGLRN